MSVSILIPTYNRKKFEKLIEHNINCQKFPFIKEVIIGDDGDEKLELDIKYPIKYIKMPRVSIGEKRNRLVEESTTEFSAFMDTDDIYHPNYIAVSVYNLLTTGKSISGSSNMLIVNKEQEVFAQVCSLSTKLNEATLVFRKKLKFEDLSSGEGKNALPIKDVVETSIGDIMLCVCHDSNTVEKKVWLNPQAKVTPNLKVYEEHLNILSSIII